MGKRGPASVWSMEKIGKAFAEFVEKNERLPAAREMKPQYAEALRNLEQVNWKVDCILSHCGPSSVVRKIDPSYGSDQLTDFLETVNQRCQFTYWFFGHYHDNRIIDDRYILQWEQISGLEI